MRLLPLHGLSGALLLLKGNLALLATLTVRVWVSTPTRGPPFSADAGRVSCGPTQP